MKLVIWPDEILEKKTEDVTDFSDIKIIADQMFKVMKASNGIGLAAPQVGLSKRLFVMDIGNKQYIVVNPKIQNTQGKSAIEEGCLSFPNVRVKFDRAATVDVQYQNENGEVIDAKFSGLEAICFQHELDHLNGEVFVRYLSATTKDFIRKRLEREKKNGTIGVSI